MAKPPVSTTDDAYFDDRPGDIRRYGPAQPGDLGITVRGLAKGPFDVIGEAIDLAAGASGIASKVNPTQASFSPVFNYLASVNPAFQQLSDQYGGPKIGDMLLGTQETDRAKSIEDDARLVGSLVGAAEAATAKGAGFLARRGKQGIQDFTNFLNFKGEAVTPDGQVVSVPPTTDLPDTSVVQMAGKGGGRDGYTQRIQILQKQVRDIRKIPNREEALTAVADAQRGIPEMQMRYTQNLMGGGVQSYAIEHTGDLLHRITEKGGAFGAGLAAPKIKNLIRTLESEYGHNRDFMETLRRTYSFYVEEAKRTGTPLKIPNTYEKFESKVMAELDAYANFHAQLPVFNDVQKAARDAAIAVGRRDFDEALKNLKFLDGVIEEGSFAQRNSAFDPDYESKSVVDTGIGPFGKQLGGADPDPANILRDKSQPPFTVEEGQFPKYDFTNSAPEGSDQVKGFMSAFDMIHKPTGTRIPADSNIRGHEPDFEKAPGIPDFDSETAIRVMMGEISLDDARKELVRKSLRVVNQGPKKMAQGGAVNSGIAEFVPYMVR